MSPKKIHQSILTQLRANAGTANAEQATAGYSGSTHRMYAVSTPICRAILKELVREYRGASTEEWLTLIDVLVAGESHEEKTMAGRLLGYLPKVRAVVEPERVEQWLDQLVGWSEVDVLCSVEL